MTILQCSTFHIHISLHRHHPAHPPESQTSRLHSQIKSVREKMGSGEKLPEVLTSSLLTFAIYLTVQSSDAKVYAEKHMLKIVYK